jgi:hypothetical protein
MATVDDGRVDVAVLDHMKFVFDAKEIQIMENEEGTKKKEAVADSPDISEALGMVLAELKNVATLLKELKPAAAAPAATQDEDLPEGAAAAAADPVVAAAADLVEAIKEEVKTDDPENPEGIGDGDGTGVSAAEDKPTMDHKDVKPGTQRVPTVKDLMREISLKNQMAETLSHHIGVFDHSEMDIKDVAKYGVKKLDIRCQPGSEIQTLSGYLQAKKPPRPASDVMDSKDKGGSKVSQYIDGGE